MGDAFHQTAIAEKRIRKVVHQIKAGLIKLGGQ